MTKNITNVQDFLKFIIKTDEIQGRAVLKTVTEEQTKAICEIFYNTQYLELDKKQRKIINQNQLLIKKLVQTNLKLSTKGKIISRRSIAVHKIIHSLKNIILAVIKQ